MSWIVCGSLPLFSSASNRWLQSGALKSHFLDIVLQKGVVFTVVVVVGVVKVLLVVIVVVVVAVGKSEVIL